MCCVRKKKTKTKNKLDMINWSSLLSYSLFIFLTLVYFWVNIRKTHLQAVTMTHTLQAHICFPSHLLSFLFFFLLSLSFMLFLEVKNLLTLPFVLDASQWGICIVLTLSPPPQHKHVHIYTHTKLMSRGLTFTLIFQRTSIILNNSSMCVCACWKVV